MPCAVPNSNFAGIPMLQDSNQYMPDAEAVASHNIRLELLSSSAQSHRTGPVHNHRDSSADDLMVT